MKYLLYLITCCIPCLIYSQPTVTENMQQVVHSGIKWNQGLSWEQVKEKAKKENKYIFIDVFATWCGPCKLMDKEVYPDKTVGNYFNEKFISIKVQTDETKKDNEQVKSWHKDAVAISKQYRVESYPAFIFLNPQGNIVHKEEAYKSVPELISMAQAALKPGKIYKDPFSEYDRLVADYKQGIKKMDRLPYMITTARRVRDMELLKQVLKEHVDYCLTLTSEQRYTKENIELWASLGPNSKMRMFQFFYKDGDKIDKVMNNKGYSKIVIDNAITDEITGPFLVEEDGGNSNMVGSILSGPGVKTDLKEANWRKLYQLIREKYNADYAKRNVLDAKIQWYMRKKNYEALNKYWLLRYEKYPPNADLSVNNALGVINSLAWQTFLYSTKKKYIKGAIKWQKKAIDQLPGWSAGLDTYANLLYKLGKKEEAIQWQEKAAYHSTSPSEKETFTKIANQMRRGGPTYLDRGAVWD